MELTITDRDMGKELHLRVEAARFTKGEASGEDCGHLDELKASTRVAKQSRPLFEFIVIPKCDLQFNRLKFLHLREGCS